MHLRLAAIVCLSAIGFATSTDAAGLAPSKPSDLRVLVSRSTCSGIGGARLDTQVLPDGTFQPFAIPPKKVLVVTGISLRFNPGENLVTTKAYRFLLKYEEGLGVLEDELLIGPGTQGSEVGSTGARFTPTPLIAVKSGTNLCLVGTTPFAVVGLSAFVYGFLAADK